jgi:predicted nucleotidyltransferase
MPRTILPTGAPFLTRSALKPWSKFEKNTIAGKPMFNQDFKEFIQSLNDNQVRYLVVGGYAVALHGYPRYTKDIDIWIDLAPANASRIIRALEQFGFGSLGLKEQDFLEVDMIIQLGYPPRRIDLLTTLPGVEFNQCFAEKVVVDMEGVSVSFIDLENLKKNKRATGRAQDIADIENLG